MGVQRFCGQQLQPADNADTPHGRQQRNLPAVSRGKGAGLVKGQVVGRHLRRGTRHRHPIPAFLLGARQVGGRRQHSHQHALMPRRGQILQIERCGHKRLLQNGR